MAQITTEKELDDKLAEFRAQGIPCFVGFDGARKIYFYGQFRFNGKTLFNKITDRSDSYLEAGVKLVAMIEKKLLEKE